MRYAKLKKLSERTTYASKSIKREQIVIVEGSGGVQTLTGCIDIHPVHVGRKARITRDMNKCVIQDLTFID